MSSGQFTTQGQTIVTNDGILSLPATMAPGTYEFKLVVVDEAQNESGPATVTVIIRDTTKPLAKLRVEPNAEVERGTAVTLVGTDSSDPFNGKIVNYRWTMTKFDPQLPADSGTMTGGTTGGTTSGTGGKTGPGDSGPITPPLETM